MMHPLHVRRAARARAARYLRRGIIDRQPCGRCGAGGVEMHHPDYCQPWLVQWRCRPCHQVEHRPHDAGQLLLWLGA